MTIENAERENEYLWLRNKAFIEKDPVARKILWKELF